MKKTKIIDLPNFKDLYTSDSSSAAYKDNDNKSSCMMIYDHIESCPVCKKLYKTTNLFHIIIILILLVITFLLVRKLTK